MMSPHPLVMAARTAVDELRDFGWQLTEREAKETADVIADGLDHLERGLADAIAFRHEREDQLIHELNVYSGRTELLLLALNHAIGVLRSVGYDSAIEEVEALAHG